MVPGRPKSSDVRPPRSLSRQSSAAFVGVVTFAAGIAPYAAGLVALAAVAVSGCTRVDAPAVRTSRESPMEPRWWPQTYTVGHSVAGRPVFLHVFGDGSDRILIHGGIHGNEPTSASVAAALVEHLRRNPDAYRQKTVGIIIAANPDALVARRRENANGVDVNRNFPARNWQPARRKGSNHGNVPCSEPETQAILTAMEIVRPARIIAIHSIAGGRHGNNYDGPTEHLARLLAEHNGYAVLPTMGYPTPGSFGSYAGVDLRIPTITLELPRERSAARVWEENRDALLAFIAADGGWRGSEAGRGE